MSAVSSDGTGLKETIAQLVREFFEMLSQGEARKLCVSVSVCLLWRFCADMRTGTNEED